VSTTSCAHVQSVASHASSEDDAMRELTTTRADISRRSFLIQSPACRGVSRSDRTLAPGQGPPLGAHIVTPRLGYTHHGIYVGRGNVVQYGGLARGLRRRPVEEIPLAQFTRGYPLWVRCGPSLCFDGDEIVRRARSRVGEDRYDLLTNNCEHFCQWCLRAEHRSYQVEEWLSRPWRALRKTLAFAAELVWAGSPTRVRIGN
jgi:hypothetical protein